MKTLALTGLLALAITITANASSLITLTGVQGTSDGADYVLPYHLTIQGIQNSAGGDTFDATCYDFFDTMSIGESWQANLLTVDQAATSGKFAGDPDALSNYKLVAALSSFYTPATTPQGQIDLQHAIWDVFDPGQFTVDAGMHGYLDQANGISGSLDYANFVFVESTVPGIQEFVIDPVPVSDTPEPGTLLMALGGMALVLVFIRLAHMDRASLS